MLSPSVKPVVLRAASHSSLACKTRRLLDGQTSRPIFPTESFIAHTADVSAFSKVINFNGGEPMTSDATRPPIVFISYSHDSQEHADRVLELSDRLRADGIDCILDQYIDSPPEGFPRWMDRQIQEADIVLMICTPTYYRRVMGKEEPG